MKIGTYTVRCDLCDLEIPCPVSVSPFNREVGSISLSVNVDVSLYEAHLETHEGDEVFDD